MSIQQVLTMETQGYSLRSEAIGWGAEDPRGAHPTKPVGICGAMWHRPGEFSTQPNRGSNQGISYPDPLRALADGWRLLAPPTEGADHWEWWFVRQVEES